MNCPSCVSAETRTLETRPFGLVVMRRRRCEACTSVWATQETVTSIITTGRPPVATGSLPVGRVSPAPPSGSVSDPDPIPSQASDQTTQIDDDPNPASEPPGFLEFWGLYPKKVGKSEARRAFKRKRPPMDKVRATLAWQVKSQQWRDGIIPNPATWLNQGRWEDEPPARPVVKGTLPPAHTPNTYKPPTCSFHDDRPDEVRRDAGPDWCVVCKRQRAARDRRGEPTSVSDLFATAKP